MDRHDIESAIEGILFASGDPVPVRRLALVLGVGEETINQCGERLADFYQAESRGIRLVRLDNALQLCSAPEHSDSINRVMENRKPPKLSQPALEVLAIIAYFQPVTRLYVEQVRGVDSSYTINGLQERGLIRPGGRLDVPGRPTIYETTDLFLRTMGICSLDELPQLPDLGSEDGIEQLQQAIADLETEENGQLRLLEMQTNDRKG